MSDKVNISLDGEVYEAIPGPIQLRQPSPTIKCFVMSFKAIRLLDDVTTDLLYKYWSIGYTKADSLWCKSKINRSDKTVDVLIYNCKEDEHPQVVGFEDIKPIRLNKLDLQSMINNYVKFSYKGLKID